jgi:transcription elongation GreA/GreB family factor
MSTMNRLASNSEFLEMVLNPEMELPSHVLLPHEQTSVQLAYNQNVETFQRIVQSKVDVTGGDDWHDGAFRVTDNEAKIAAERNAVLAPFLGALVVGYPKISENRVTLGSRATLLQNGYEFPIDLVGFRGGYPEGVIDARSQEEVSGVSPESPLGKVILGKMLDEEIRYKNGNRIFTAKIKFIDQEAVKLHFEGLAVQEPQTRDK